MKNCQRILSWLVVMFIFFGFWGSGVFGAALNDDATVTLKIIHTNDTHGRYTYNVNQSLGYAKLKTIINREEPDLTVDAGDVFHGQSFATIEKGGSIAELMAAVGFDAMAPGNHDFNYGSQRLKELGLMANTKILGANVLYSADGKPFFTDPYMIKEVEVNGEIIKIGVFGLINPNIFNETAPLNVAGLSFGTPASTIKATVDSVNALKEQGCDVIVALTHLGDSTNGDLMRSDAIANAVSGIDVIIDGHTHDIENREINGTLIVQTGCYCSNVGILELVLEKKQSEPLAANEMTDITAQSEYTVVNKMATLITAEEASDSLIPADETVAGLIAEIEARQAPIKNEIVGSTPVKLGGITDDFWVDLRLGELNLGRVLTDSYRYATGADIAIDNAGGIRAEIQAGDITKGQVIDVLPFGNYLVTKEISGTAIKEMLENNVELGLSNKTANDKNDNSWPTNSGSFLQWSGVKAQYDVSMPKGERINAVTVGGVTLDPNQMYTVACSSYSATNDDYPELSAAAIINEFSDCDEVLTYYLQNSGNERFLTAINESNIMAGKISEPETAADPEPVEPEQKQSSSNPKTGNPRSDFLSGILLKIQALDRLCFQ
ncbi:MAG: bifunctional metallophosphatase/5'-nucleotidase [Acetobacterium sp.]